MDYLGLDISKLAIDCKFKIGNDFIYMKIDNTPEGFEKIIDYINQNKLEVHARCEATGIYYIGIAEYLHKHGVKISVLNPLIIKHYAKYHMMRNKTDKKDAELIALYCSDKKPPPWHPQSEAKKQLQSLNRRIDQLNYMQTMEKNRLQVADTYSRPYIENMIGAISQQIEECRKHLQDVIQDTEDLAQKQKLLQTIKGVGQSTAAWLLSVLIDIDKFQTAKHFVSFLGLAPVYKESGTSVKSKPVISKMGDKFVRKALYWPARSACTRSKLWRPWYLRKLEEGKHPKQIYVAMMRKMCVYAYTILKTGKPFDENMHKTLDA